MQKRKTLTNLILLIMEKSIDGYMQFEDFAYNPLLVGRDLKKSELSLALKRLRERGLIDFISDDQLSYRLTDKGKQKAVWESISLDDEKWDGIWRLVIFDIPEKRRAARSLLRYSLKKWGFTPWQQSVWATKKNCAKPLREFIKSVGIEDWVMVVESNDIGK